MRFHVETWPDAITRPATVPGGEAVVIYPASGPTIQHEDGTVSPAAFTYMETPEDPQMPRYVVEVAHDDDGLPRVSAVHVLRRSGGREIRSSDVRHLRSIEDVIEDAWRMSAFRQAVVTGDSPDDVASQLDAIDEAVAAEHRRVIRGLRRQARRKITPDLLAEVAHVYREHLSTGAPTKAVGDRFGLAPSTASLYVKRARDAGLNMGEVD